MIEQLSPQAQAEVVRRAGRLAEIEARERLRRRREFNSLPAQAGRVAGGLWRSIVSGGWD